MTARGRKAFAPLEAHTRQQVGAMLERLGPHEQDRLVSAMGTVETLLAPRPNRRPHSSCANRAPATSAGW